MMLGLLLVLMGLFCIVMFISGCLMLTEGEPVGVLVLLAGLFVGYMFFNLTLDEISDTSYNRLIQIKQENKSEAVQKAIAEAVEDGWINGNEYRTILGVVDDSEEDKHRNELVKQLK